jgi:pyrimidine-nucleoside phosphorylase
MTNTTCSISDILSKKRDGGKHSPEEIYQLVRGYVTGDVADYKMF